MKIGNRVLNLAVCGGLCPPSQSGGGGGGGGGGGACRHASPGKFRFLHLLSLRVILVHSEHKV